MFMSPARRANSPSSSSMRRFAGRGRYGTGAGDEIAAADFGLHHITLRFEEALYRRIQRRLGFGRSRRASDLCDASHLRREERKLLALPSPFGAGLAPGRVADEL